MRILIATEFFPESASAEITGGVESRAFYIAKELAKTNPVYIITSRRPNSKKEVSFLGMKILRVGPEYEYTQTGHLLKRLLFSLSAVQKAGELMQKEKIEVVDGYSFFAYPLSLFASVKNLKSFLTYHEVWIGSWAKNTDKRGIFGEISERIVLLVSRLRNLRFIAVSDFTKHVLIENNIPSNRISVIPNGVSLSDYDKIKAAKSKNPTICFMGRLTKNKRLEDLILAIGKLREEHKNLRCLIIGSGSEEANLKRLVKDLGLESCVDFTGFLKTHTLVLRKLRSSHLFCSPSVVEGFGITLVEAIAMGIPFVCSDIAPFREISGGKGGLHFKSRDSADLASKLRLLMDNKALYQRCISEEKVLSQRFDWAKLAKKIEEEYKR